MPETLRPVHRALDDVSATLLHRRLVDAPLPPPEAGSAWSIALEPVASTVATRILMDVSWLHGVRDWNPETFRSVFLDRVLPRWRRGMEVSETDRHIVVRSTGCPLLAANRDDPRTCRLCQSVQARLLQAGTGGAVDEVTFEGLVTEGDTACTLVATKRG